LDTESGPLGRPVTSIFKFPHCSNLAMLALPVATGTGLSVPRVRSRLDVRSCEALRQICVSNHQLWHVKFGHRKWALTLLAAGAWCSRQRPSRGMRLVAARAQGSDLELEAAKLRAEAEALQKEAVQGRRMARARELLDGAKGLRADMIQTRLGEVVQMEISLQQAEELLSAVSGSQELQLEDLSSAKFEAALESLRVEIARAKEKALALEREEAAKVAQEQQLQQAVSGVFSPGSDDDDRGLATRLLGILAYVIPLIDGLPFSLDIFEILPGGVLAAELLSPLVILKRTIPFGDFIFLFLLTWLAKQEFPLLMRYSFAQAVVLDILFILPQLILSFTGFQLPESLLFAGAILLNGCIAYSVVLTLLGKEPDNIGFISDASKRNLGR